MKLILKYISIFAIVLFTFSCDFDENGEMPNDMVETSFPYIEFDADESDPFINLSKPAEYSFTGTVDVLFKEEVPFDKLRIVVAFNGAYDEIGTIEDNIVAVPYDITVTTLDMIDALSSLNSIDDLEAGDAFHVYVIPTIGGMEYPPYQMLDGRAYGTTSASVYQNLNAFTGLNAADVRIPVPCELRPELMVGSYYAASDGWGTYGDVTIEADPNDPYKVFIYGLAALDGLEDNGNGIEINIDPVTYLATPAPGWTILAPNTTPWGFTYPDFHYEPNAATYNTCDGSYTMNTYIGIFFGGPGSGQAGWGNFDWTFTRND